MARINIEDSLFRDSRWIKLLLHCGCHHKALGMVTSAWMLAQKHWTTSKSIPKEAWEEDLLPLLEVGLAQQLPSGDYYVKGSTEAFSWLDQRIEAGRKGGLSERKQRKNTQEELLLKNGARVILSKAVQSGKIQKPSHCQDCGATGVIEGHHTDYTKPLDVAWLCKHCHTEAHRHLRQAASKRVEATAKQPLAEANPLVLTPSLSPPLTLSPVLSPAPKVLPTAETWKAYRDAYVARYQVEPLRDAKTNAQIKRFVERVGQENAPAVAGFYLKHNLARYQQSAHSVDDMLFHASKLHTEWRRGEQITSASVREVENKQNIVNVFAKHLEPADGK